MTINTLALSNSSRAEIEGCPRKYQIRKRFQHSVSQYDTSLAAQSGTCIHTYLQSRMAGKSDQDALLDFFWEWDFSVEENDSPKNKRERNLEATILTAQMAWRELQFNPDHLARLQTKDGVEIPATEVGFEIILKSTRYSAPHRYIGYIDFITYLPFNDMFTVWDIKTNRDMSTAPKDYKYKYDTQTVPYGLVISAITGKPLDTYQANYLDVFIDPQEPRVQPIMFTRTHNDVLHWLSNTDRLIRNIEEYIEDDVWPRTSSGCMSWGKPCRYFKYCDIDNAYQLQLALLAFGPAKEHSERPIHITSIIDVDEWLGRK